MRWVVTIAACAACGRINFGEVRPANDSTTPNDGVIGGDGALGDVLPFSCPPSYTRVFGGAAYRVQSTNLTWLEAEAGCEADGPTSHLAVIESQQEAVGIANFALFVNMWIGVTQRAAQGTWRGVTGTSITYLPWSANFPMSGGSQDCVLWLRFQVPGAYENNPCNNMVPSVCECDGIAADPAAF